MQDPTARGCNCIIIHVIIGTEEIVQKIKLMYFGRCLKMEWNEEVKGKNGQKTSPL